MSKSFPSRRDGGLLVAVVLAATLASGVSTRPSDGTRDAESGAVASQPLQEEESASPLIDYLNAVAAATAAAD